MISVQSVEWLTSCIQCRQKGAVTIANSKTDYVIVTERGWDDFETMRDENHGRITSSMLELILPDMIALLETKTSGGLGARPEGFIHQAVLEYLAVNGIARRQGTLWLSLWSFTDGLP